MSRTAAAYQYEMKKLLFARKGWLILLCTVLLQIGIACFAKPYQYYSFDTQLYKEYAELYAGPYSKETERIIHASLVVSERLGEYKMEYEELSSEEMREQNQKMMLANLKTAALNEIQNKYAQLSACKEYAPEMTYDIEATEYFQKFGMNWAALIGMALLLPLLMLGDANCGMEQILFPTITGQKRITLAKLLTACSVSAALMLLCTLLQWGIFSVRWDFGTLAVPVQSLTGFGSCTIKSSISGCMILFGIIRILAAPAAALLLCLLSVLIRKEPAAITAWAVLIGCSAILASKISVFPVFSLYSALSGLSAAKTLSGVDAGFLIFFLILKTGLLLCGTCAAAEKKK